MATKTFEELKQQAIQIRDEKANKQNTATRVGTAMLEQINKLEQDYYEKTTIDNRTNEYNVSINHPGGGVDGNRYTLSGAIDKVPAELRNAGVKVSFLDESGLVETWEFQGGSWAIGSFSQVGAGRINEIGNNFYIKNGGFSFIKELYVYGENIKDYHDIYVSSLKRNASGTWQFSIKGKNSSEDIVVLSNYIATKEDIGIITLVRNSASVDVQAYAILIWDNVELGFNGYDLNYPLADISFDLDYSPSIKEYLLAKDVDKNKSEITLLKSKDTNLSTKIVDSVNGFFLTSDIPFFKELYVCGEQLSLYHDLFVGGLKRNASNTWQLTIKGKDSSENVQVLCTYQSQTEENGILILVGDGSKKVSAFAILYWSNIQDGFNGWNVNYPISNKAFNLDYSPSIKSYLLGESKQEKLISGVNIKTINGQPLLGAGDITIKGGEINSISNILEENYAFGNQITVETSASKEYKHIKVFSKPNITVSGENNIITFPKTFSMNIGDNTIPITIENDGLKSIKVEVTKQTRYKDFTYSNDTGEAFISDSIEIVNNEIFYIERIGKKTWHTGEEIPSVYLSDKVEGLVDGCTIYYPLSEPTSKKLKDVSNLELINGEIIATDNNSYLYIELGFYSNKTIIDKIATLTRMGILDSATGITVKSRNLAYDKDEDMLYFCGYEGTLYKIDVSVDSHPKVVGTKKVNSTPGHVCSGCAITENYLYVVDRFEGGAQSPSYLTVIKKSDFSIVTQIDLFEQEEYYEPSKSAMSPCSCFIFKDHLFICGNSYFWGVYDITTDPENPTVVYKQTYDNYPTKTYREYQRVAFWSFGGHDYVAFAGFSSGISFWNIDNLESPVQIGNIKLSGYQTMDVLVEYPYLYIPCSGSLANRFSHFKLNRSVIMFDISDLTIYENGVDIYQNPYLYNITNIPYNKFFPNILNEGDPAPSRIVKLGNFIAVNYAEAGTAIFSQNENGVLEFQNCYKLSGNGNTCQSMLTTKDGRLFISNIYGKETGLQVYRLGNIDF